MCYRLTLKQWTLIDACYKTIIAGQRYFRECAETPATSTLVPVIIDESPAPVEAPAHYGALWPLDPRD